MRAKKVKINFLGMSGKVTIFEGYRELFSPFSTLETCFKAIDITKWKERVL